jgi:hypothetical protein
MSGPQLMRGFILIPVILFSLVSNVWPLSEGYLLFGAYGGTVTALIDKDGKIVKQWDHSKLTDNLNGYSCYMLPNGHLLRSAQVSAMTRKPPNAAPVQGIIDEIDSAGKVVWTYTLFNDTFMLHHDMKPLPNGHILATCFQWYTKPQVKNAGIDTTLLKGAVGPATGLLGDRIIEIDPTAPKGKEIVWEWRIIDHVVPKENAVSHPEKISGSIVAALWQNQWVHLNGLDYNPKKDLIVWSSRIFSECFVIDHSTTTEEAKGSTEGNYGKGGDILYRWGNPAHYGANGAATIDCLHSTTWIPEGYPGAGDIMFFHNNIQAIKSQVIEIKPPMDADGKFIYESGKPFGPTKPTWLYAPDSAFYSRFMSSAMRMPNGHTLTHETFPTNYLPPENGVAPNTDSRVREVDSSGSVLWEFTLKQKSSSGFNASKVMYYPRSHAGICKLLNLGCLPTGATNDYNSMKSPISGPRIRQIGGRIEFSNVSGSTIGLFDLQGKKSLSINPKGASYILESGSISKGVYCAKVTSKGRPVSMQLINVIN